MSETESSSDKSIPEVESAGFYEKFIDGQFGLAKTYWLFGVLPSFFVGIAFRALSSDTLAYCIGAVFVCYQVVLLRAIWSAGKKYQGSRVWSVLAFLVVLLSIIRNVGPILAIGKN